MTEIEKVKSEIRDLQARLLELEREEDLANSKSPAERAFYAEYKWYPSSDDNEWEGSTWCAFKRGYEARVKEEEETQPTKSVNSNSSESLLDILSNVLGDNLYDCHTDWYIKGVTGLVVDAVEEWLIKPQDASGTQNGYVESAVEGWNDAIKKIKSKLR